MVVAATTPGSWVPAEGYAFVNDDPSDLHVRELTPEEIVHRLRMRPSLDTANELLRRMRHIDPHSTVAELAAAVSIRFHDGRLNATIDPEIIDWVKRVRGSASVLAALAPPSGPDLGSIDTGRILGIATSAGESLIDELAKAPTARSWQTAVAGFVIQALFEIGKAELEKSMLTAEHDGRTAAFEYRRELATRQFLRDWHEWPVLLARLCRRYSWRFPRG
ncbi:MAG: hypothetical protein IPM29_19015 [Planctomycetes bacterium]|nr:hypothetical protein [Planctomycetota bacterium]